MKTIGIAGPSSSRKSTVARLLQGDLQAPILSVDLFYYENAPKIYVHYEGEKLRTFERTELYDGNYVADVIDDLKENNYASFVQKEAVMGPYEERTIFAADYLIIEGFLAFMYPKLFNQLDYKFFINVSDGEILRRRALRGGRGVSDETFKKIGIAEYHRNGMQQKDLSGVIVLNGHRESEDIYKEIKNHL